MLIISENELLHTDSCQDIIEHHGVKGMKWGQRTKNWAKSYGGLVKRAYRHPGLSLKAYRKSKGMTGNIMSASTRHMEYRNRVVDDMVKAKKQYKKDKNAALDRQGEAQKKMGNAYVGLNTRYKNDINNAKAKRAKAFVNAGGKF